MEQEYRASPHRHERYKRVVIRLANRGGAPQEQRKQHKNRRTPDKSKLLPENAEDKVRMFFGQEREIRLGTVSKALATNTATTNCRERLQHLIAIAQRVTHRIQERVHALLLVRLQHVPHHRTGIPRQDVRRNDHTRELFGQVPAQHGKNDKANQHAPQNLHHHRLRMRKQH